MTPLLLLALGLAMLVAAAVVLRSFGPRYRVGRLLASTPRVSVGEALALAREGTVRYVRVDGRIDAEDEFEDADHRPLVFRRTRLQAAAGRGWRTIEDRRDQVAFTINEGLDTIAIDTDALDAGLVVVPRESVGTAADLGVRAAGADGDAGRPAEDLPPETPVRARIEQLSSVEHATALGVPVAAPSGARLTAGLGRPLVLTTLEPREAMRILAEGRTAAPRVAAALIGGGVVATVVGAAWFMLEAVT